jgi:FtsP/CotA-like multicopper oxidase with cupredoxin domain
VVAGQRFCPLAGNSFWVSEYFGDTICVNGKATLYVKVEPRKYRFRLVNGSNSRFYHLTLMPADENGKPTGQQSGQSANL